MPKVIFAKKSKQPTPHIICPPPHEVFADAVAENAEWFLPLLTIDLQGINPDWRGKAHFVYHEANRDGGVTFKLIGDKYSYAGTYGFDGGGMAQRDKNAGYVELVELEMPELTKQNRAAWVDSVAAQAKAAGHKRLSYANHFGCCPYWTQQDETPRDPDGAPMLFIGQIRADDYSDEVADADLYLFFSPNHNLVTQIDQCT